MLDKIKTRFSISELENLSGISIHTIRIWERRYELLKPKRTETNIRYYDNEDLKKLLNVATLHQQGYKISKLATFSGSQLSSSIEKLGTENGDFSKSINAFKLAMFNFDRHLFQRTYNKLSATLSFNDVFIKVILPFLDNIGTLWQTTSITPAHEHFISNLIRQKLFRGVEELSYSEAHTNKTYVLFLPMNEIHELGLLFIHYNLLLHNKNSIYLGQSVETGDLSHLTKSIKGSITYITSGTVYPETKDISSFLSHFEKTLLGNNNKLWITGRKFKELDKAKVPPGISVFENAGTLLNKAGIVT